MVPASMALLARACPIMFARATGPNANLNRLPFVTAVSMALISHGRNGAGSYQSNGAQLPGGGIFGDCDFYR